MLNSRRNKKQMLKRIENLLKGLGSPSSAPQDTRIADILIEMSHRVPDCKVIKWKDGTVYVGESVADTMEGQGRLDFPNGDSYEGSFKGNQFEGPGKYQAQDGLYDGEWQGGLKWGSGRETNSDGSSFVGKYERGLKEGFGYFEWADGSFYQGMFKQDYMHGPGKMVYADGSQLEAEWHLNEATGSCRQIDSSGNVYTGQMQNGLKNGNGILVENNKRTEGWWRDGVLQGPAMMVHDGTCMFILAQSGVFTVIDDCRYQELVSKTQQ